MVPEEGERRICTYTTLSYGAESESCWEPGPCTPSVGEIIEVLRECIYPPEGDSQIAIEHAKSLIRRLEEK